MDEKGTRKSLVGSNALSDGLLPTWDTSESSCSIVVRKPGSKTTTDNYTTEQLSERIKELMALHLGMVGRMPARWLVGYDSQLDTRSRHSETGRPTITTIVRPSGSDARIPCGKQCT